MILEIIHPSGFLAREFHDGPERQLHTEAGYTTAADYSALKRDNLLTYIIEESIYEC